MNWVVFLEICALNLKKKKKGKLILTVVAYVGSGDLR
jgi:hypothetical protein